MNALVPKNIMLSMNVPAIIKPPATNVPVLSANAASPSSMRFTTSAIPGTFFAISFTLSAYGAFVEIIMHPMIDANTPHAARNIG